jgi:hypothetical protein
LCCGADSAGEAGDGGAVQVRCCLFVHSEKQFECKIILLFKSDEWIRKNNKHIEHIERKSPVTYLMSSILFASLS